MMKKNCPGSYQSHPGPNKSPAGKEKQECLRGVSTGLLACIEEAKDALLKDVDGNVYLDFTSAIGVQNVGHCDQEIVAAIQEQAQKLIHPCFHVALYEPYIALAERMCELVPISGEKRANVCQ